MKNPFINKKEAALNFTQEFKNILSDKKAGDSFALPRYETKTFAQVRAILKLVADEMGVKYKTKVSDGTLFVLILER